MGKRFLTSVLISMLWLSSFAQKKGAGPSAAAAGAAPAAAAPAQIQPGYHYYINNLIINGKWPYIHKFYKAIKYTKTNAYKVPCLSCTLPKNTPTVVFNKNPTTGKYTNVIALTSKIRVLQHRINKTDTLDSIQTNFSRTITTILSRRVKDTMLTYISPSRTLEYLKKDTLINKQVSQKYTDTCSAYFRYWVDTSKNPAEVVMADTIVRVTEVDTSLKYFPDIINNVKVGFTQDSGKLQMALNGMKEFQNRHDAEAAPEPYVSEIETLIALNPQFNEKIQTVVKLEFNKEIAYSLPNCYPLLDSGFKSELLAPSFNRKQYHIKDSISKVKFIATVIDKLKISPLENKFLARTLYHPMRITKVDSTKDTCAYCGHATKSDTTLIVGAYVYTALPVWQYPTKIAKDDSVNNFYIFIKKRNQVKDPIYINRIPFARWEAGVVNIPLEFTPGYHNAAENYVNASTNFLNINAFFGRAWGSTDFYYDPAKTHTAFTGMFSVFGGFAALPTLTAPSATSTSYNLLPSAASLAGTSQMGFSYGVAATVTLDLLDLGLFFGNTIGIGSPELTNGWYYENKWWIGFGIGINIGLFNNALSNPWE